jgi:hypothetical protein
MPKFNLSINALAIQGAQRLTSKTGKDCLVIDLDASRIQRHQNGKLYLNLEMSENRDGEDQYGNSHRVAEPTTKDERGQGVKLPILSTKVIGLLLARIVENKHYIPAVMTRNVQRKHLAERQHQKDTDGLAVNTYLI